MKNKFLLLSTILGIFAIAVFVQKQQAPSFSPVLGTAYQSSPQPTDAPFERILFNDINQYRLDSKLPLLERYEPLCNYAVQRADEVATNWSHDQFYKDATNKSLWSKICPSCIEIGENLAHDYDTPKDTLNAWIASPLHKKNLEKNWDWGCIAKSGVYTALVFGRMR